MKEEVFIPLSQNEGLAFNPFLDFVKARLNMFSSFKGEGVPLKALAKQQNVSLQGIYSVVKMSFTLKREQSSSCCTTHLSHDVNVITHNLLLNLFALIKQQYYHQHLLVR